MHSYPTASLPPPSYLQNDRAYCTSSPTGHLVCPLYSPVLCSVRPAHPWPLSAATHRPSGTSVNARTRNYFINASLKSNIQLTYLLRLYLYPPCHPQLRVGRSHLISMPSCINLHLHQLQWYTPLPHVVWCTSFRCCSAASDASHLTNLLAQCRNNKTFHIESASSADLASLINQDPTIQKGGRTPVCKTLDHGPP